MRSLGCQHTDVVFNIKHTVADGISNGNANGPFRNDFTSPVYLLCIIFLEVSTIFSFQLWKKEIEKRTKMKTCINISFPSKVRFRKKVHSQTSDHVWFFLNLFSKRPREKKRGGKKEKKEKQNTSFLILFFCILMDFLSIRYTSLKKRYTFFHSPWKSSSGAVRVF